MRKLVIRDFEGELEKLYLFLKPDTRFLKKFRGDKMSDNNINDVQNEEVMLEEEKKEAKLSLFQRIIKVFTDPVKAMEDISIKPKVLVPVLLISLVFILLNVARFNLIKEFIIKQLEIAMAQNPNIGEVPEGLMKIQLYTTFIIISITPLLTVFFKGLVSHGIAQLFNGKGKLKASISVITFSYFIVLFGEAIRTIIGLLVGNYMVTMSLAAVAPNLEINTPLYNLLASFDVFSIWYLMVSVVGISVVHKISRGKAAVVVLSPWALMIGFNVVMAILRG